MNDILYCSNKLADKKLFFSHRLTQSKYLKDAYDPNYPIVVFGEDVLKNKFFDPAKLSSKVCLGVFSQSREPDRNLLAKLQIFDVILPTDTQQQIAFKLNRAQVLSEYKKRIISLEGQISNKNEKINKAVLLDPLSGCYNWRYFLHRAHQELSRARRHIYNVSFLVVDIDFFRRINELYTAKIGDDIIKELVGLLNGVLRKEDVMARWREDEFFIILPYLSREDALRVANRIKVKLASHKFSCGKLCISLKFSMGLVSFPEDIISNTRDVINALEKCLMTAKRRGGDVVVSYAQPRFPEIIEEKRKTNVQDLRNKLEKLNTMLTRDVLDMIYGFVRTIELKDSYTGEHMEYTAVIAENIAKALKLKDSEIENVRHAGVLHDLGKVGIDESILAKKGPLSVKERDIIKAHPWIATEILREVHALVGAIPAVLYHHERFDGKGYPLGLKGIEIPLSARIVAVADVYQALISNRPYRKAFTKKQAIEIIKKSSGDYFDPQVVKVFLKITKKLK